MKEENNVKREIKRQFSKADKTKIERVFISCTFFISFLPVQKSINH